jgi:hypothetical protein
MQRFRAPDDVVELERRTCGAAVLRLKISELETCVLYGRLAEPGLPDGFWVWVGISEREAYAITSEGRA